MYLFILGGAGSGFDPPAFVWVILIFYIIFFNCFAINMFLQYKQIGWWSDKYWGWKLGLLTYHLSYIIRYVNIYL